MATMTAMDPRMWDTVALRELTRKAADRSPSHVRPINVVTERLFAEDKSVTQLIVAHEYTLRGHNPTFDDTKAFLEMAAKALLFRDPTVKSRKAERRLMMARGNEARRQKAKRSS